MDLVETDDHFVLRADLPGLSEDDVDVTLENDVLTVSGQRKAETEVILKDGESFAIAGLIDNRVIETLSKIRGLGDEGQLFGGRAGHRFIRVR